MLPVADNELEAGAFRLCLLPLRDKREIGNKFAAAPEVACDFDARKVGVIVLHGLNRMLQQSGRSVQVQLRLAAARNGEVLKDLCLQGCAKAFDRANAIFLSGRFEVGERGNSEFLVELENLVRPQPRNSE